MSLLHPDYLNFKKNILSPINVNDINRLNQIENAVFAVSADKKMNDSEELTTEQNFKKKKNKAITEIKEIQKKVCDQIETTCQFWYKEVPRTAPEEVLLERYRDHFNSLEKLWETILKKSPPLLIQVLKEDVNVLRSFTNEPLSVNKKFMEQVYPMTEAYLNFLEKIMTWLEIIKQDLESLGNHE